MAGETMRAWTFTRRGTPSEVLQLQDLPRPQTSDLQPDEVLVKVTHVGMFQGFAAIMAIVPHLNSNPWIPGSDFSGFIISTGSLVTHVKAGDAVFGSPNPKLYFSDKRHNGLLTEYAILPSTAVVKKPESISLKSAAGIGGNGSTAMQFSEKAKLGEGMKVLITGASGSTGSLTLQAARARVGKQGSIWVTCSVRNAQMVRDLGADEVNRIIHQYQKRNPNISQGYRLHKTPKTP